MADPIDIITRALKKHTSVGASMARMLKEMPKAEPLMGDRDKPGGWKKLEDVDWSQDAARVGAWLTNVFETAPPVGVRAIWIGVPDVQDRPPVLTICGLEEACPKSEEDGWEAVASWPQGKDEKKLSRAKLLDGPRLKALEKSRAILKLTTDQARSDNNDLCYALPISYATFIIADAFIAIEPSLVLQDVPSVEAVCGYAGGDWVKVGTLSKKGWRAGR